MTTSWPSRVMSSYFTNILFCLGAFSKRQYNCTSDCRWKDSTLKIIWNQMSTKTSTSCLKQLGWETNWGPQARSFTSHLTGLKRRFLHLHGAWHCNPSPPKHGSRILSKFVFFVISRWLRWVFSDQFCSTYCQSFDTHRKRFLSLAGYNPLKARHQQAKLYGTFMSLFSGSRLRQRRDGSVQG